MAIELNGLASFGNIAIVTPEETGYQAEDLKTGKALGSMIFDIEEENSIHLQSLITDHVTEKNTTVSDHISLKPEIIVVRGLIAELNNIAPKELSPIREAAEKLTVIDTFQPSLSISAIRAYNSAFQIYQFAQDTTRKAIELIKRSPSETKQQRFFRIFYDHWLQKKTFTVQTPWLSMTNMSIESLKAIQSKDSKYISDFEIKFKKIRFAETLVVSKKLEFGRSIAQGSSKVNNGAQTGIETSVGFGDILS